MEDMRVNRRRFVAGGGSLAAAAIFAPGALAEQLAGRRVPTLRGGSFSEGVISGDPTPSGVTLWTRLARRGGHPGPSTSRSPATRASTASSAPTSSPLPPRPRGHALKVRVANLDPPARGVLLPLRHRLARLPRRRALPHGAAAGLQRRGHVRLLLLPELAVGLLHPACGAGPARTSTSWSTSATTSTPTPNTVPVVAPCAATRCAGGVARASTATGTGGTAAPTRTCGRCRRQFAMVSTWDDHEVTDDYAGNDPSKIISS